MKKGFKKSFCLLLLPFVILVQSCVVATKDTLIAPQIRDVFKGEYKIDPYMEKNRPRTVAVLPFHNKTRSKEGSDIVRKGFYNHFSSLPFKDMELYRIDNLLRKADLTDTEVIFKKSPRELGNILGVDAVVYGEIYDFDKLFAVVYSQVSVGAEIKMYDAKTGHFLWSGKHTARIHEGGVATTPVGLIATVIATALNVRDIQLLRACDDLFRDMVKTIPAPTIAEALRPPVITLLTQDTKNLPKKAGDDIRVIIQGTPKMQASFSIGDYKKNIDMQEIEPGGYLGTYKVIPGDNVTKAMITGYLRDDAGNTAEWVDALGSITLDTMPPEKLKNVTSVGRNAMILLAWAKSTAADLAGYRIYRSSTPLSGFQMIATTEFNEYRDEQLINGQKYYYQITASDFAGNEGEPSDVITGMPVAPGPTLVSGIIESDTTWYAGASPYVVQDTITVKDKALLTIEPGTEIRSQGGGIVIEGRLKVQGDEEHITVFDAAAGTKSWEGILFSNVKDKENLLKYCRVRGAATGITCQASSPRIEACELTENGTAITILGAFSKGQVVKNIIHKNKKTAVVIADGAQPVLNDNTIRNNLATGILIQSAAPVISRNCISHNQGSGIVAKRSQATLTENNFVDNKPFNIEGEMSGESVNTFNNWWGSVKGLEIFSGMKGKIDVRSILNAPYPEGKPLELAILSQYLGGAIKKDAFLIMSHSPYRVSKDVVIDNGATLYIEPGVTITYDQNTSMITEDGGIVANGTKDQPIIFTASAISPSPGFYRSAVKFKGKGSRVNSFFTYCIVKYSDTAFDIHYGAPEISYCHIAKNAQSGVFCRNDSSPKISYCTFTENLGEGGIKVVGMSRPKINYNNFIKNDITDIQAFSTIRIDATHNWWGQAPPDERNIFKQNDDSINVKPWLTAPDKKAFIGKTE
jgi:parallel beta-helix repeat protein